MGGNNVTRLKSDVSDASIPIFGISLKKTSRIALIGKITLDPSLVSLKGKII